MLGQAAWPPPWPLGLLLGGVTSPGGRRGGDGVTPDGGQAAAPVSSLTSGRAPTGASHQGPVPLS